MGRLTIPRRSRAVRRLLSWLAPLAVAVGIVLGVNSLVTADTPPDTNQLAQYLQTNTLNTAVESVEGYQQIYYTYNGQKIFLTGANYSHTQPVVSGEYVAWEGLINGAGQIYVYDVLTQALTQVTSASTNQNPAIYQNTVAWESWQDNSWQIFYYDGFSVKQISADGVPSVRPTIRGRQIIYAEQFSDGWAAMSYDLSSGQYTVLRTGDEASTAYPHFEADGSVKTAIGS
jgi:beta propeller repeat protein